MELNYSRLVLGAGGAKIASLAGVYEALVDFGIMSKIKIIAGSSAGAICAALMAVGIEPNSLYRWIEDMNFVGQLGKITISNSNLIAFDGQPIKLTIEKMIDETIRKFIYNNQNQFLNNIKLYEIVESIENDNQLTFQHLTTLVDFFPEHFKQLVIIAVETPSGRITVFDRYTPTVPIASACLASAAIPLLINSHQIEINGEMKTFIDGGFYEYIPTNYFDLDVDGTTYTNLEPDQTLVIVFADHSDPTLSSVYKAINTDTDKIYEPTIPEVLIKDRAARIFSQLETLDNHSTKKNESYLRIRMDYADSTIIIKNGDIREYEFWKTTIYLKQMIVGAYYDVLDFFQFDPSNKINNQYVCAKYAVGLDKMSNFHLMAYLDYYSIRSESSEIQSTEAEIFALISDYNRNRLTLPRLIIKLYAITFKQYYFKISKIFGYNIYTTSALTNAINSSGDNELESIIQTNLISNQKSRLSIIAKCIYDNIDDF